MFGFFGENDDAVVSAYFDGNGNPVSSGSGRRVVLTPYNQAYADEGPTPCPT